MICDAIFEQVDTYDNLNKFRGAPTIGLWGQGGGGGHKNYADYNKFCLSSNKFRGAPTIGLWGQEWGGGGGGGGRGVRV